jgi:hypothetical protein
MQDNGREEQAELAQETRIERQTAQPAAGNGASVRPKVTARQLSREQLEQLRSRLRARFH